MQPAAPRIGTTTSTETGTEESTAEFCSDAVTTEAPIGSTGLTTGELATGKRATGELETDPLAPDSLEAVAQSASSGGAKILSSREKQLGTSPSADCLTASIPPSSFLQDDTPIDWVSRAKAVTTVEQAIEILSESDFHGRWEVIKRFPDLGSVAIAPLIAIAQDHDNDTEHRWFAIRGLGRFSEPEAITALSRLVATVDHDDLSTLAAEQLAGLGKQAVTALIPLLDRPTERFLAVRALAQIRQRTVIEPLLGVLNDPDPDLRQTALEALGSFHDPRVTTALLEALTDPSGLVRKEAVITLGHRHDLCNQPDLLKPLEQCLWDLELDVCCQAAVAIGRLGLTQSLPALTRLLASAQTPEPLLLNSVRSISWLDTATALTALIDHYRILPPQIQLEVIRRLGQLTPDPHRSTQFLLSVIESQPSQILKQAAALSVGQLGDKTAFRSLVPLLADSNRQVQFHCLRALEQLAPNDLETDLEAILNSQTLPIPVQERIEAHLSTW
ncbi:MAG: HEAT repeat domain-containing protein [Cyanobacteria bacterium J06632_22]